jgi:hypothetical protein
MKHLFLFLASALYLGSWLAFAEYPRFGVFAGLLLTLVLIVAGFVLVPRLILRMQFSTYSQLPARPDPEGELRLLGQVISSQPQMTVESELRNTTLLYLVALVAGIGCILLPMSGAGLFEPAWRMSDNMSGMLLIAIFACFLPLMIAMKWFGERWRFRNCGMVLGFITPLKYGKRGWIQYEFRSRDGDFFGGTDRVLQNIGNDNTVLVFVPLNPTFCQAQCSFLFHGFRRIQPESEAALSAAEAR